MKSYKGILVALLVLAFAAAAVAAPSALTRDTLIVGTESTYKPFEFRNEKNELVGYDVDLVEAIGKKLGKKIEWVDMSFDGLLPAVMTHKIDLIAAAMTNTEARQQRVSFTALTNVSNNGLTDPSVFIVLPGNEKSAAQDFAGKVIAVQLGTTQDFYLNNLGIFTVKNYQKNDECLRELLYGRVDAVLINGASGYQYCQSKDFKGKTSLCAITDVNGPTKGAAFAVAKDDPELLAALDKALQEMKDSGEYFTIRSKWGLDDWMSTVVK